MEEQLIGTNVRAKIEGDTLVLRIKHTEDNGETGSGKNIRIGSANNAVIDGPNGPIKVGLNVYKKK